MDRRNQVAGIVYRNICTQYGKIKVNFGHTSSRCCRTIQSDFQMQNAGDGKPAWHCGDRQSGQEGCCDRWYNNGTNIRRNMWNWRNPRVWESSWRGWDTPPPKLEKWLQQIPGATSEVSILKSAVLGTAKILQHLPEAWKRYVTWDKWADFKALHFQISYLMWFGKWVCRYIWWWWGLGRSYILRKSDRIPRSHLIKVLLQQLYPHFSICCRGDIAWVRGKQWNS